MIATVNVLNRYMVKRPGSTMWQLRKPVPADVQAAFGKVVVTKSLGTSNDRDATKAAMVLLEELEERWEAIRKGVPFAALECRLEALVGDQLPERTRNAIIKTVYTQVLESIEQQDIARSKRDRLAHNSSADERRAAARNLAQDVRAGDIDRFIEPTEKQLKKYGVAVDREAPWFLKLVRDVALAVVEAQAADLVADRGRVGHGQAPRR